MKALLLLVALSATANNRGRIVTPRQNTTTVAPVPALPIVVLNAATFATTVNPTLRVDAPASIPVLTPLRQLSPADAPTTPAGAPTAPSQPIAAGPAAPSLESAPADVAPADAPRVEPLAAAPADAPSFVHRTVAALGRLINPFGEGRKREEPPPASEAERLDREFMKLDLWGQAAPRARAEIAQARAQRLSKAAFKEYVQAETAAAFERIKAARGTSNIGFHYNLHGGLREDYVGGGLRAGIPDDGSRDVVRTNAQNQVYFFQTSHDPAYAALDANHPAILLWPSRMGSVLNVFAVDAPAIEAAKADGRIRNHGRIAMDFHGMKGIPYSTYLAPPVRVFDGSAKKALGLGRLTRDEENLATVRYLEAALLAGGDYVPR